MMTLRKTWHAYGKGFTFTADVETLNEIAKDLHDYEMQYLNRWIDKETYVEQIRKYLSAMHVEYTEIEEV